MPYALNIKRYIAKTQCVKTLREASVLLGYRNRIARFKVRVRVKSSFGRFLPNKV